MFSVDVFKRPLTDFLAVNASGVGRKGKEKEKMGSKGKINAKQGRRKAKRALCVEIVSFSDQIIDSASVMYVMV